MSTKSKPAKSTPGPWTIDSWRNGFVNKVAIQGPDGHGSTAPVCWVEANRPSAENEPNAHLIAAAPDLLTALEGVMEWQRGIQELLPDALFEQMRSAIAKAKGGAS